MYKKTLRRVLELAAQEGIDAKPYSRGRKAYSGRGMFGATCRAIVCGRYDIGDLENLINRRFRKPDYRIDNLGLDYIVY